MRTLYLVVLNYVADHKLKALFIIIVYACGTFVAAICNNDRNIMFF